MYYTLTEENTPEVIAVVKLKRITRNRRIKLLKRTVLAVKEHFIYRSIDVIDITEIENVITVTMDCTTEDEDDVIREVKLTPVVVYK